MLAEATRYRTGGLKVASSAMIARRINRRLLASLSMAK
jgi:hypothetical protein